MSTHTKSSGVNQRDLYSPDARSKSFPLTFAAAFVVLLTVSMGSYSLYWAREVSVEARLEDAKRVLYSASRHVREQYDLLNDVADEVIETVNGRDLTSISASELRELKVRLERPLVSKQIEFFIFDKTGQNIYASGPGTNVSDREYFRFHAFPSEFEQRPDSIVNVANGLVISVPYVARLRQRELLAGSKKLNNASGDFQGVVAVSIPTSAFLEIFSLLRREADDTIFMARNDRIGMVREPAHERFAGQSIPNALVFQNYPKLQEGRFRGAASTDGIRRIGVHLSLAPLPLVLGNSLEVRGLDWESLNLVQPLLATSLATVFVVLAFSLVAVLFQRNAVKAEARLRGSLKEQEDLRIAAEAANVAKSNFLATMSHELRSPLNAIIGFAEMIYHGHIDAAKREKVIEYQGYILKSGRHLLALINDVLDLSRVQKLGHTPEISAVEIKSLIEESVLMASDRAEKKQVHIVVQFETDANCFQTDRRLLFQVLVNLVVNAVKFSPPGKDVRIRGVQKNDTLEISVSDEGPGMSQTAIDSIGKPFLREQSAHLANEEGIGLGLAICVESLNAIGGNLRIQNRSPSGLQAEVKIPRPEQTLP